MLLILIVPIYSIGYCIYTWGEITIRNQVNDSESKQVDFYMGNLDNEMERIQNLQFNFFNNTDLNVLTDAYAILSNYDRDESIIRIESQLISIKNSSQYISEVMVYIPKIHKKISSNDVDELNDEDIKLINSIYDVKNSSLFLCNGQLLLNAEGYMPSSSDNTKLPKFFFEIQ